MAEIWMDVDAALAEVPICLLPLIDDTDFKTREESVTFDQSGLDLLWNFETTAGAFTQTAVTPTDTAGDYDWVNQGNGLYTIEIPASGGATINNDAEGFGWFTGFATGILPWRGPVIGFRAAGLNNVLIDTAYSATRGLAGTALPDAVADAANGLPISDAGGLDLDTQLAETNEVTAARMGALTDWIDAGRLDLLLDAIKAITDQFVFTTANQVDSQPISVGPDAITAAAIAAAAIDNATFAADVGSTAYATNIIALAVRKALDEIKLDHLIAVVDSDDPVNGSLWAELLSATGDASTYVPGTDSLEAAQGELANLRNNLATLTDAIVLTSATIETVTSQTVFVIPATADAVDDDAYNGAVAVFIDGSDANQKSKRLITDYDAGTRSVTVATAPDFTITTADTLTILASTTAAEVWDERLTGNEHNLPTSAGRRLRQIEEAFVHASGVIATVTNGHTFTLDTGAVDTADYYVGDRLQITEGTGAGQSRVIIAYSAARVAILDSDYITNPDTSSLYEIDAADVHVAVSDSDLASGFVAVYTNTTTITLDATIAVANADFYVGELIVFTHGTGAGQAREIVAYTAGRVVTMSPALDVALSTDTVFHIQAAVSIPEIVDEILDEDMTAHQTTGTLGQAIGDPGANTETMYDAVVGDAVDTNVATDIAAVKAETALIVADTNELQTDWTDAGRLDAILDAVLAMLDDARAEPGQGALPGNPDAMTKIDYIYKLMRNKKDNDGATSQVYADDDSTVDHKQTTSEAAGTVTKAKWVTGP